MSITTIRRWIRAGYLRASRTPGSHRRILRADLERFLARHEMVGEQPSETKILVVDDDPLVLGLLVDCLAQSRWPIKIETAIDGYEALIKIGTFRPSIVILDIFMPGLDGIEVCRRLKAEPETRGIRILGLTGHHDAIPALLGAGGDACLAKPVDLQHLEEELRRMLAPAPGR